MIKTATAAVDLPTLLDGLSPQPRILSLDCFDTLLWRNVQAPRDVFADLAFPGGGVEPRVWAESKARAARRHDDATNEVSIEDIYTRLLPDASDEERVAAIAAELAAEARHCFAFPPAVALLRAARVQGLDVMVVSDTYLAEPQLRALIRAAAGEDVAGQIGRIFCSSEYGIDKSNGLFRPVLADLGVEPAAILHVGDNLQADAVAPHALGIRTVHFRQFDAESEQRFRLEAAAAAIMEPATRVTVPTLQPHRAAISLRGEATPAAMIGNDVIGPLIHTFARWLRDEMALLAETHGRPVRPLFLLRDGYLPHRMFAALGGDGATIEISRFAARRASFCDEAAIRDFLHAEPTERIEVLANQLLLNPAEAAKLGRDHKAFRRAVLHPAIVAKIVARSRAFADRLIQHVIQEGGVAPGDTMMLIDLGYKGTVQALIARLLSERLGGHVAGRYLLLRSSEQSVLDRRGLFDTRHYETKALQALYQPIAMIEQFCTAAQGSAVDYSAQGKAIRKAAGIKGAQNATRDVVQAAALAFARTADAAVHRAPASDDADARRRMAMAILARLLFLPQAREIAVLATFDHDINLGTDDMQKMIDPESARTGLRRRGLSYLDDAACLYRPGELQPHGLPLNLSLFGIARHAIELRTVDFQGAPLSVSVIMMDGAHHAVVDIPAYPTHDGFHLMTVPIGAGRYTLGVQLGAIADWVQIEEIAFHRVAEFGAGTEARAIAATAVYDAMEGKGEGLYHCLSHNALLFVPPPAVRSDAPLLLALAFRVVVARREVALRQVA